MRENIGFIKSFRLWGKAFSSTKQMGVSLQVQVIVTLVLASILYLVEHPADDEYTVISDLRKSLEYVEDILGSLQRRFPHAYKTETQRMMAGEGAQNSVITLTF